MTSEVSSSIGRAFDSRTTIRDRIRSIAAYAGMVGTAFLAFHFVRRQGQGLQAPPPAATTPFGGGGTAVPVEVLLHVLAALTVIIVSARLLGLLFRYIHQPPVVGEVLAGILLGPSFLGRMAPAVAGYILPSSIGPFLSILAQVGILLYMFLVGIEFDATSLRSRTHAAIMVSHASIAAPFILGVSLALVLYPRVSTADVPFSIFALFMGVSMSVTAFPVLARILTDRSIQKTRLGVMALTCAAVDDVTAWCLLAFLVSVAKARAGSALVTAILSVLFIVTMILAVRPFAVRLVKRQEHFGLTRGAMTAVCVALLLSSLITEFIGIHAIFGAFLLGTLIPHDSKVAQQLLGKLEDIVVVLFLPAYFAFTGMRTQIGLMTSTQDWLLCAVITTMASLGKFGGSLFAARFGGCSWRESASLGILMNTRGLMELIVLNIGLDLKVVSPVLYAMLIVMALATTLATSPLLHWFGLLPVLRHGVKAPETQPQLASTPDRTRGRPLESGHSQ